MKKLAREYLLALQYFSRIPLSGPLAAWAAPGLLSARACAAHFPGVGMLIGMAACVAFAVVSLLLPDVGAATLAAAIGCTIATVLLTGAVHEAGLARLADGLGGRGGDARALVAANERDTRTATPSGTLALVLLIGMKVALLAVIATRSPAGVLAALVAAHAVSRFWPLVIVGSLHHVGDPQAADAKPFVDHVDRRLVRIGALWCLPALALMFVAGRWAFVLLPLALSAAAFWAMRRLLLQRLQGFTVGALGATQQVCEVAFYLGAGMGIGPGR